MGTQSETTSQFAGIVSLQVKVTPNQHPGPVTACVCSVPAAPFGKGTGTLTYFPTGETIGFPPRCDPYPRETVLRDHNPTCDIQTYVGGLSTCHHGWHLLDADQEIPWKDQPLSYHFKWRFYFQEYDPARHVSAYGWNTVHSHNLRRCYSTREEHALCWCSLPLPCTYLYQHRNLQ